MVTITNREIYDKVCEVEKHVVKTNGKVKLNKWIATTALSFGLILIGILMTAGVQSFMMAGILL